MPNLVVIDRLENPTNRIVTWLKQESRVIGGPKCCSGNILLGEAEQRLPQHLTLPMQRRSSYNCVFFLVNITVFPSIKSKGLALGKCSVSFKCF